MKFSKAKRAEIIDEVALRTAQPKKVVAHIFHTLMEVLYDNIKEGKQVSLTNIGTFYFKDKKAGKSNLTGQYIPPHKQLRFKFNAILERYIRVMSREI